MAFIQSMLKETIELPKHLRLDI
ncbi:MAG: hypothetical protein RJB11_360, partial [Planctomycetota bacterium]